MVGRRLKKGVRRGREELRALLEEYDYLLMVSDVLGVPVSEEGEMLKDIIDQHPEYEGFLPGEEIEMEADPHMREDDGSMKDKRTPIPRGDEPPPRPFKHLKEVVGWDSSRRLRRCYYSI